MSPYRQFNRIKLEYFFFQDPYMNYGESCSAFLCNAWLGFACVNETCDCTSTLYWNGSACINRTKRNDPCTNTTQCLINVGLICQLVFDVKRCECDSFNTRSVLYSLV